MKKKGLVISTIVMVVVLIAALTTSTYAWFTATNATSISNVEFSVVSGGDVLIGAHFANTLNASATADQYLTGSLTWDGTAGGTDVDSDPMWTGGTRGLASSAVTFGGIMSATLEKAIGFGVPYDADHADTTGTAGATFDAAHVVKANGNDTLLTKTSVVAAVENQDYVHLVIGVKAGREGLATITLTMTLTDTTANKQTLGMMAATHYTYGINAAAADANNTEFCGASVHYDAAYAAKEVTITIASNAEGISVSQIYALDLYVWIDGNDADCNASSLGSALRIAFAIGSTDVE